MSVNVISPQFSYFLLKLWGQGGECVFNVFAFFFHFSLKLFQSFMLLNCKISLFLLLSLQLQLAASCILKGDL